MAPGWVALLLGLAVGSALYFIFTGGGGHKSAGQKYKQIDSKKSDDSDNSKPLICPICFEVLNGISIQITPCKHAFHKLCLTEWKERGHWIAKDTCPICRKTIGGAEVVI